jgi:hypothetical protein
VDFDWQRFNLFDELSRRWLNTNNKIYVQSCRLSHLGDLLLYLSEGFICEIFLDVSGDTEAWRMLGDDENADHFVVGGSSMQLLDEEANSKIVRVARFRPKSGDIIPKEEHPFLHKLQGMEVRHFVRIRSVSRQARIDLIESIDTGRDLPVIRKWYLFLYSGFRLLNSGQDTVLLSSADLKQPRDWNEFRQNREYFDWSAPGATLFDDLAGNWARTNLKNSSVFIEDYELNTQGDLTLRFSNGQGLRVFVAISNDLAAWTLEPEDPAQPYFAVTGTGAGIKN